jgi:hypothetical protein
MVEVVGAVGRQNRVIQVQEELETLQILLQAKAIMVVMELHLVIHIVAAAVVVLLLLAQTQLLVQRQVEMVVMERHHPYPVLR